jgi:hypothetical protein
MISLSRFREKSGRELRFCYGNQKIFSVGKIKQKQGNLDIEVEMLLPLAKLRYTRNGKLSK